MTTRRALLTVAAGTVAAAGALQSRAAAHPDDALLALCARLEEMRIEWQRLYDATSDEPDLTTPADHAWQAYSDDVWPRVAQQPRDSTSEDVPALLLTHQATTLDGLRTKAAAILAMDQAASYLMECRDDSLDLSLSLLRDAAGSAFRPVGASPTPLRPVAHAA